MVHACERITHPSWRRCAPSSRGYQFTHGMKLRPRPMPEFGSGARRLGRSAGAFDVMIAAHAEALGATLVTNDVAIKNLKIEGLKIVSW